MLLSQCDASADRPNGVILSLSKDDITQCDASADRPNGVILSLSKDDIIAMPCVDKLSMTCASTSSA